MGVRASSSRKACSGDIFGSEGRGVEMEGEWKTVLGMLDRRDRDVEFVRLKVGVDRPSLVEEADRLGGS